MNINLQPKKHKLGGGVMPNIDNPSPALKDIANEDTVGDPLVERLPQQAY